MFSFWKRCGRSQSQATDTSAVTPRRVRKISHKLGKLRWRFFYIARKAQARGLHALDLDQVEAAIATLQAAEAEGRAIVKAAVKPAPTAGFAKKFLDYIDQP